MDFGKILDKWEKQNPKTGVDNKSIYDKYEKPDEEQDDSGEAGFRGQRRSRLLKKKPDASIDLHGLNSGEAWTAMETFFNSSRAEGHEKLLIIHGKGNHKSGEGVSVNLLKDITKRFIEYCKFAGESGHCHTKDGGSGATWVILKE